MKPIKNINAVFSPLFFTVILAGASVPAYASWENVGMNPVNAPPSVRVESQHRVLPTQHETHMNIAPPIRVEPQHRVQPPQHEVHMNVAPSIRVEPQRRVPPPQPTVHNTFPVRHNQAPRHYETGILKHIEGDLNYYNAVPVPVVAAVPDDLEEVVVDGQTYFYSEGVFYQQQGDQLVTIGAVVGAVVDYLPPGYQIVMADGVNYFVWGGVYYERLAEGFEVVVPPDA